MNQNYTRTTFLTAACAFIAAGPVSAQTGPWWDEVTLFSGTPPAGTIDFNEYVLLRGGTIQSEDDTAAVQQRYLETEALGGHPLGFISVFNAEPDAYANHPELADLRIIDVEGNPLRIPWKSTEEEPVWWMNTNLPAYRDFLKEQAFALIDVGADGLNIDEIEGTAGSLVRGGSFAEEDMAGFRTYLGGIYTDQELEDRYGILDLSTFNYQNYIQGNEWVELYLDSPQFVPLFNDFQLYQRLQAREQMNDFIADVRSYAEQQGVQEFPVTGNLFGLAPHQLIYASELDFLNVEYPYRTDFFAPDGHAEPFLKLSKSLGLRSVLFPSVFTSQELLNLESTNDLMELWIMEAFASGNAFLHLERYFGGISFSGDRQWFQPDLESTSKLYQFVEDNPFLSKPGKPLANVGYVYSHPSDLADNFRYDWLGASYPLLDAGIQYDVMVMGDDFLLEDRTPNALGNEYEAMVLPYATHLSDEQVTSLTTFVEQGGLLVVIGEAGSFDETGADVDRPAWDSLVAEGDRQSGLGRVVSLNGDYGSAYRDERSSNLRRIMVDPILAHINPVVESTAERTIQLSAYRGPAIGSSNTYLLNVANTDYSDFQNQIFESNTFNVTMNLPEALAADKTWQLYRFELGKSIDLVPFAQEGPDSISWTAAPQGPHVTYLLVARADAQGIANEAPALNEAVLADAVEGAKAAGLDVSRVEGDIAARDNALATDDFFEFRRLTISLNRDVLELQRPRILFNESLAERNTLLRSRALELRANDPESVLFSVVTQRLETDFNFIRNESDELTLEKLNGFDGLLLAAPSSDLTDDEIAAVHSYIDRGGSVLLLGDANYGWSNGLTEPFGIRVAGEPLSTEEGVAKFGNVVLNGDPSHPAMALASRMDLSYSGSLLVEPPAQVVGETPADTWLDMDRDFFQGADEPVGPFAVAAAYNSGGGKVFVLADNSFNDNIVQYTENTEFLKSVLSWLVDNSLPDVSNDLTFSEWTEQVFGPLDASDEDTVWGAQADPDKDGAINFLEYLRKTNATLANGESFGQRISINQTGSNGADLQVELPMRKTPAYIVVEQSEDLSEWTTYEAFWSDDEAVRASGNSIETSNLPMNSFYRVVFEHDGN